MTGGRIFDYYKRQILRASFWLLVGSLSVFTLVFLSFFVSQEFQSNELKTQNRLNLANQIVASLSNTYDLIGNSSHSIIALKYGDYAGYRKVVLPWIKGDPRITAFQLKDSQGNVKVEWSKAGEIPSIAVTKINQLVLQPPHLATEIEITDGGVKLGAIVFFTDLKSSGLEGLGVIEKIAGGSSCQPLDGLYNAEICSSFSAVQKFAVLVLAYLLASSLLILLVLRSLTKTLGKRLKEPIEALHHGLVEIQQGNQVDWTKTLPGDSLEIFKPLGEHISKAADDYQVLKAQARISEETAAMAAQVSHDIRSPLSALSMVASTLTEVSEDKRQLIRNATQRINDIANDLLRRGNRRIDAEKNQGEGSGRISSQPDSLASLVDTLVSEKRIEFRSKGNVDIDVDLSKSYGLFSFISSGDLTRALSNLINNAVESLAADGGRVVVAVMDVGGMNGITIQDNGKGMSAEVLRRVGDPGFSVGKSGTSGSGLGVFQAKTAVAKMFGKFEIVSELAKGTTVSILLPKADPPSWFLDKIGLKGLDFIVSIDDDSSVQEMWRSRLASDRAQDSKFLAFSNIAEFRKWHKDNCGKNAMFLIDFEFVDKEESGLDLIVKDSLASRSALVTSHANALAIKNQASSIGFKLLPKNLAPLIPISEI